MKSIYKIIEDRRKELKLSLRNAAKLIGISHSYLSNLEKGVDPRTGTPIKPTPETLELISKAYRIDYNYLMKAARYLNDKTDNKELSSVEKLKNILTDKIYKDGIVTDDMSDEEIQDVIDTVLKMYKIATKNTKSN